MITEVLTVRQDGEMCLVLTQKLLKGLGWQEGDKLVWENNRNGTFLLKKDNTISFNPIEHEQTK
tara:strand:- start:825 stop:1016 length:192 start_codon:yes stop_codon:yes gene_type:complete